MKRTTSPALTSPWKIGFLVSLMLVFVSIGVSYYFVHQYDVPLNVLQRDWLDRSEWLGVIRGEGFLFEILPLVGLVVVTAMISYMTITAAVRKYKKYLDSGHDYKNLLSSLKEIQDIEDKRKIERIKNHPELKRLLLGVAESLEQKERLLSEREGALETRLSDSIAAREREMHEDFARQCDRLSKATEARSVDPSAIEFANPDLARLSKSIERALQSNAGPAPSDLEASYADMMKTAETFQSKLREVAEELRLSRETAQGIEQQLRGIARADESGSETGGVGRAAKEIRAVIGSLRNLDDLAAAIDLSAEEARGVAINTALRAGSGEGTQDDLIRLAEDVKEVAGRFKDQAKRFFQLSTAMRSSAGTLETLAADAAKRAAGSSGVAQNLASILSRVSLWVERNVVLSDRVMNLSETYGVAIASLAGTPRETTSRARAAAPERRAAEDGETPVELETSERTRAESVTEVSGSEESEEFGFQTLDRSASMFTEEQAASAPAGAPTDGASCVDSADWAKERGAAYRSERAEYAAGGRDIDTDAGRGVFEEMSARPLGAAEDDVFGQNKFAPAAAKEPSAAGGASERPEAGAPPSVGDRLEATGFLRSPLGGRQADGEVARPAAAMEGTVQTAVEAAANEDVEAKAESSAEPEDEVFDLYELGAVDYDPAVHG